MTRYDSTEEQASAGMILALLFALLGTVGVVVAYFSIPGFRFIEPALLLIPVAFGAVGFTQNILRGVISAIIWYIAAGLAAVFYLDVAPFVGAFFGNVVNNSIRAFSFGLLMVVVWVAFEYFTRLLLLDTSVPLLGILDTAGGFLMYLAIGVLIASILFNTLGFGSQLRVTHNAALLRPTFNWVFSLLYRAQAFWIPGGPPPIYTYDLQ